MLRVAGVDFAPRHRQPSSRLLLLATAFALTGSLLVDDALVHAGTTLFPSTRGFAHFRVSDYASLTVIGVLVACAGWPIVTRVTSAPRRLFFRLAVAVTVVLWLPDGWLLLRGETGAGVAVLMAMHLAIAVLTYNVLVHVAPVRRLPPADLAGGAPRRITRDDVRRACNAMAVLVGLELAVGVAAIVTVPFRRPDAVVPSRGTWVYAAHGAIGVVLGVGAIVVLVMAVTLDGERTARIGAWVGAAGVAVGMLGGVLATFQSARLLGMGVMMLGVVVAGIGYLVPSLEAMAKAEAARAEAARAELGRATGTAAPPPTDAPSPVGGVVHPVDRSSTGD
jgi:hypothetical protein